jgi:GWxTD domain-containing protein
MKKLCFAFVLACLYSFASYAQDASLSYATFKTTEQPYIEIYLHLAGSTVTYQQLTDSTSQAGIEVLYLFKQGEQIVQYDKFNLLSPVTDGRPLDFIDIKRYGLPNGNYNLVVAVKDLNNPENAKEYSSAITIDYPEEGLLQSDIQLLASYDKGKPGDPFVKNGVHMEPLPYNFYGKYASNLSFYTEIYHADKVIGEDFMVSYSIEKLENGKPSTVMIGHKRKKAAPIIPLLQQMDITQLPSGNYQLVIEIRNRLKERLSRKVIFFQRSNPFLKMEELDLASVDISKEFVNKLTPKDLKYSLRALTPKLPSGDVDVVDYMLKNDSIAGQRLYLFSFWAQNSPNNPEAAYNKYMEVARAIDKQFNSGFRYGFETDRGYIYLKYGQPDDIVTRETEPSAPPYEIWSYNEFPATRQNNVRFVFYNPSLAPGNFQLLHSDVIGEMNNPNWQHLLYSNAPNEIMGNDYFQGTQMQDNFNRNANRIFRDY